MNALYRRDVLRLGLLASASAALASCGVPLTRMPERLNALAVTPPGISGCAAWLAQPAKAPIVLLAARPTRILVHHTASANTSDLSQAQAFSLARNIQQGHFARGWIDTGQQFTVSRGGFVLEGRHRSLEAAQGGAQHVQGAHCDGQNDVAVGIENEGTYMTVSPPAGQYGALVSLCAWLCQQYGIPATELYGHRDFNSTACPGDVLYAKLPQLRADVAARLGVQLRIWPTTRTGMTGERVRSAQRLLMAAGQTLTADGSYGSGTASAVSAFQSGVGLTPDGLIGSATWERLIRTVRRGDSGAAVQAAQGQLAARGYAVTADGAFGPTTESALKTFQASKSLAADGIVGPSTWLALES